MSYQSQDALTNDAIFQGRNRSVATQQADAFRSDARPAFVALANAVLRGHDQELWTFASLAAAGPGIADKATNPDGISVDQSKVTDADLLSLTQANWPTIAGLYYSEDGTPL